MNDELEENSEVMSSEKETTMTENEGNGGEVGGGPPGPSQKNGDDKVLIKIIMSNDMPYIWNAEEYLILRNHHKILGYPDGASARPYKGGVHYSQTLPIRLNRFEAYYLIKHGLAMAFQLPVLKDLQHEDVPGKEQVEQLKCQRKSEELQVHRNKRRLQIESMVDKIIEGKRRKGRGLVPDRHTVIQEEISKVELPFETTQIDISDPWIKDTDFIPTTIPSPLSSSSLSSLDKLRYLVFEDWRLHHPTYFLTSGLKFGADFVAYPGDPIDYHSQFCIICHDNHRGDKHPYIEKQIRLANIVHKILIVAYLNETTNKVKYVIMNKLKGNRLSSTDNPEECLSPSPSTSSFLNDN